MKICLNCKRIFRETELVSGLCWACDTPEIVESIEEVENILQENNKENEDIKNNITNFKINVD